MRRRSRSASERYPLERSPLAQNPSQRDVAELVRETKADLNTLAVPRFKEQFIVCRTITKNGKDRQLVYPKDAFGPFMSGLDSISRRSRSPAT